MARYIDQGETVTHIDVGKTRQEAHVIGGRASVLCRRTDGETIHDDSWAIRTSGGFPVACDCPECKAISELMYQFDCDAHAARQMCRRIKRQKGDA